MDPDERGIMNLIHLRRPGWVLTAWVLAASAACGSGPAPDASGRTNNTSSVSAALGSRFVQIRGHAINSNALTKASVQLSQVNAASGQACAQGTAAAQPSHAATLLLYKISDPPDPTSLSSIDRRSALDNSCLGSSQNHTVPSLHSNLRWSRIGPVSAQSDRGRVTTGQ